MRKILYILLLFASFCNAQIITNPWSTIDGVRTVYDTLFVTKGTLRVAGDIPGFQADSDTTEWDATKYDLVSYLLKAAFGDSLGHYALMYRAELDDSLLNYGLGRGYLVTDSLNLDNGVVVYSPARDSLFSAPIYIGNALNTGENALLILRAGSFSTQYSSIVFRIPGAAQYDSKIVNRLAEGGNSTSLLFEVLNKDAVRIDTTLAVIGDHVLINPLLTSIPVITDSSLWVRGGGHFTGGLKVDGDITGFQADTDTTDWDGTKADDAAMADTLLARNAFPDSIAAHGELITEPELTDTLDTRLVDKLDRVDFPDSLAAHNLMYRIEFPDSVDAHTELYLVDGSRSLTGNIKLNNHRLTNDGGIGDGLTISNSGDGVFWQGLTVADDITVGDFVLSDSLKINNGALVGDLYVTDDATIGDLLTADTIHVNGGISADWFDGTLLGEWVGVDTVFTHVDSVNKLVTQYRLGQVIDTTFTYADSVWLMTQYALTDSLSARLADYVLYADSGGVFLTPSNVADSLFAHISDLNNYVLYSDSGIVFLTPVNVADSAFAHLSDLDNCVLYSDSGSVFLTPANVADSAFLHIADSTLYATQYDIYYKVNLSDSGTVFLTPKNIADSAFVHITDLSGYVAYIDSGTIFLTPKNVADSLFLHIADSTQYATQYDLSQVPVPDSSWTSSSMDTLNPLNGIGVYYSGRSNFHGLVDFDSTLIGFGGTVTTGEGNICIGSFFGSAPNSITDGSLQTIIGGYNCSIEPGIFGGGSSSITIIGAKNATIKDDFQEGSVIVGGDGNEITTEGAQTNTIIGGYTNIINDWFNYNNTIIGGDNNTITDNTYSTSNSSILGSSGGTLNGYNSIIIGGYYNTVNSPNAYSMGFHVGASAEYAYSVGFGGNSSTRYNSTTKSWKFIGINVYADSNMYITRELQVNGDIGINITTGYPRLVAEAGSTTNPQITWNGDEDTGFSRGAGNVMSVITGGVECLQFGANHESIFKDEVQMGANAISYDGSNGISFHTGGEPKLYTTYYNARHHVFSGNLAIQDGAEARLCFVHNLADANKEYYEFGAADGSFWLKSLDTSFGDPGGGGYAWRVTKDASGDIEKQYWDAQEATHMTMSADSFKYGDISNYNTTSIESDGTIHLVGDATVWKDVNMDVAVFSLPVASQPDEVQYYSETGAATGIYTYGFAIGEKVSGSLEIPHDYKEGTNIAFHIHWQGSAAPTGTDNVQWRLTYTIGKEGATLDNVSTITKQSGYDTQYEFVESEFTAINGSTFNIEDQFLFTLERISASSAEYAGDAIVSTVGFYYEVDTMGSRTISSK